MTEKCTFSSVSEEETLMIARQCARFFHPGDVIILDGELGAGKTCFVKGFTDGAQSRDPVTSPTFSIANFYRTIGFDILHIDLYRISTVEDLNDLGLLDYFEQSVVLIEWGKKFAAYFETFFLLSFAINDDTTRTLTFTCQGEKNNVTMAELRYLLKGDTLC